MPNKHTSESNYKQQAVQAAKDLGYGYDFIETLKRCDDENQISDMMAHARNGQLGRQLYNKLFGKMQTLTHISICDIRKWYELRGGKSLRICMSDGHDLVFTYRSDNDWTLEPYHKNTKK